VQSEQEKEVRYEIRRLVDKVLQAVLERGGNQITGPVIAHEESERVLDEEFFTENMPATLRQLAILGLASMAVARAETEDQ